MRKLLIGLLAAASALTPVAASAAPDGPRRGGGFQARAERVERSDGGGQRGQSESRPQRAERQQQRQARQPRQAPQAVQQPAQAQAQAQAPQRRQWQGRGGRDNANRAELNRRIQETREASRQSAEGLAPRYQRQAAENQRRSEQRLREQYRDNRRDNDRRDWRDNRNDGRNDWRNGRDNDRRWSDNRRDRDWNRGWRNDRRYDWQRYRYSNRNIYRLSPYYAPYRGYSYSRFSIGFGLDPLFYGSNYWISDPFYYRLPPAPPGARWVRYYDDVVLVDLYSGQVIDVIYDFFW